MQENSRTWVKALIFIVVLGVLLPFGVKYGAVALDYYAERVYEPASIVVDTRHAEEIHPIWQGVAQGYEDPYMRLDKVAEKVRGKGIEYIKLDHVLDGYNLLQGIDEEGQLILDFYTLDLLAEDIISIGAKPYFTLSFTPEQMTDGDIYDVAKNPEEWQVIVNEFVRHYSSKYSDVIYEVWNEPDIYGNWRSFTKNAYVDFYESTVHSAASVNYKPFTMGGPAISQMTASWIDDYLGDIERVRRDFLSYHVYGEDVDEFVEAAQLVTKHLEKYGMEDMDIYVSEFGMGREDNPNNDGSIAAAHMAAVYIALIDTEVDMAMPYMLRDSGVSEDNYHGGQGMLTNPGYGPIAKKPRMIVYEMFLQMRGDRIPLVGEGTYVSALAMRDQEGVYRIIVVNYDSDSEHSESVPIKLAGLNSGEYEIEEEYLSGKKFKSKDSVEGGQIVRQAELVPNDVLLLTMRPL